MLRALLVLALLLPADITPRGEYFRPQSARKVAKLKVGTSALNSFHYSRDGRRLFVLTTDGKLSVWEIATRKQVRQMPGAFMVNRFQVSSDGSRALAGHFDRRSLRLVDLDRGEEIRGFSGTRGGSMYSFSLSPDGRKVATCQRQDGSVRLYDAESGEELRTIAEATPQQSMTWSPDGHTLAMHTGGDSTVRFYDTLSWEVKGTFVDKGQTPLYLGFTPDSRMLVHIGVDARMKVIDTAGRLVKAFDDVITGSRHVAFSRDGRWMAASEVAGKVRIWDTRTWAAVRDIEAPAARQVAFSPDGRHLSLAMEDGIHFWGGVGPAFNAVAGDGARGGAPGYLGIMGSMEEDEDAGVVIERVLEGGAAEKAGLKAGDRIVRIGGSATDTFEVLRATITTLREGDEVEIVYLRDGAEKRAKTKLGARPPE